jgi:gag-polyprotein putative aspartyl protease
MRRITTPVEVSAPFLDPTKPPAKIARGLTAIWDTGATGSVITQRVLDQLQIPPAAMTDAYGVDSCERKNVYLVDLLLPMNVRVQGARVIVGEVMAADVLVGMDVITMGEFVIANHGGRTKMSFCLSSQSDLDFAKQISDFDFAEQMQTRGTTQKERRAKPEKARKARRSKKAKQK